MNHKVRRVLVYLVVCGGLAVIAFLAWDILTVGNTGEIAASKITLPKTDAASVSAVRDKEPGEQKIDFSEDPVGGRTNPFTSGGNAVPITEEPSAAPSGTPTDNPLAETSNEFSTTDEPPAINLDEL